MSKSQKKKKVRTDKGKSIRAAPESTKEADISYHEPQTIPPTQKFTGPEFSLTQDARFAAPEWQQWPFNLIYQSFLLTQQSWHDAISSIDGMSRRDEQVVSLVARQMLDMMSPSNLLLTNPEVLAHTMRTGGANLIRGTQNMVEDWMRAISGKPPLGVEDYQPGRDVAVTPGKVIWRSHLLELIQYAPQTDKVAAEPILIVPAWIMKYYILDLSPYNSFVHYLVEQGFTVFMISWRNPDASDRDLGMEDYLAAVDKALDAIGRIVPEAPVHGVGYCLGGTLMSIKAAQMARDQDDRLKTLTLFAARTDFEDPGELELLISEYTLSFLESMMSDQGYLDIRQVVEVLKILRSNDFIWPFYIRDYLMGDREPLSDVSAWSADTTRMPYRMHSEYLRRIVLNDELAQGRYQVNGKPVAIGDISVPMFCVATTDDHVAPWKSVYKLHSLAKTDLTFALTSGGHVDGIVTDPDGDDPRYRIATTPVTAARIASEEWRLRASVKSGSWWPELATWLRAHSSGAGAPPPMSGAESRTIPLEDAPGNYVFQR